MVRLSSRLLLAIDFVTRAQRFSSEMACDNLRSPIGGPILHSCLPVQRPTCIGCLASSSSGDRPSTSVSLNPPAVPCHQLPTCIGYRILGAASGLSSTSVFRRSSIRAFLPILQLAPSTGSPALPAINLQLSSGDRPSAPLPTSLRLASAPVFFRCLARSPHFIGHQFFRFRLRSVLRLASSSGPPASPVFF